MIGTGQSSPGLQCIDCRQPIAAADGNPARCAACGREYPVEEGIVRAMGELSGKNRIAAAFYDGPRFQKFRFWENLFLLSAGGLRGARRQILRHLPPLEGGRLLEVGIGDGANVPLLPEGTEISGIDIALRRLRTCRCRFPSPRLRLLLAEGERLPFADQAFDAVLCVGGFNFFSDAAAALAEMARVARPGGRIVVADEILDFLQYGWGHRIRIPALDDWLMLRWFGPEFREMILHNNLDINQLAAERLADYEIHSIWRGYGYCLVGRAT